MLVDPGSLNGWAICAATVAAYALGGIWYAPPVLGAKWLAALGKKKEDLGSPVKPMAVQFVLTLISSSVLAMVVMRFGAITWIEGAAIGFVLAVGLVAASALSDAVFCGLNAALYWIQTGYRLVSFAVMGAILGAWR